jgi:hypothetical protein
MGRGHGADNDPELAFRTVVIRADVVGHRGVPSPSCRITTALIRECTREGPVHRHLPWHRGSRRWWEPAALTQNGRLPNGGVETGPEWPSSHRLRIAPWPGLGLGGEASWYPPGPRVGGGTDLIQPQLLPVSARSTLRGGDPRAAQSCSTEGPLTRCRVSKKYGAARASAGRSKAS